jgi:peptidoglycan/xylan/chitin deacetylase (PgdA/CDA1 family)
MSAGTADVQADDDRSRRRDPPWIRPLLAACAMRARQRLTVLIFHRVRPLPDPLFPGDMHAAAFRERIEWVRNWFNVLPLDEAAARLARRSLPARALAISFDDGYADNQAIALPILQALGVPATFFIATGFLDGGRMWNDSIIEAVRGTDRSTLDLREAGLGEIAVDTLDARRRAIDSLIGAVKHLRPSERSAKVDRIVDVARAPLPRDLMMSSRQVRSLVDAGMSVGAHTISHPILAAVDDVTARREIVDGRGALEAVCGARVSLFAYPNGRPAADYHARHAAMVREAGFDAAFSTAYATARPGDSAMELPRATPWEATQAGWGLRLARNLFASARTA